MMQSTSEGCMNIAELANQLRREKIFINSEKQLLQNLNEEVERSALELLQASWICSQQRQNLTNLITSRCEAESIAACQRASLLDSTTFVDAYKVLKYREATALGELLGWLRDSPHFVALCLLLGEDHMPPSLPSSLVAGLYGSCRSPADRTRLLAVIRSLIKHQMATSNDPRKLFRGGKCALASLYAVFRDGHSPARQFLVAALQGPVMAVLHEDEFFLDVDPDKAMERFSPADRLKKFGQPNSAEYAAKVSRYRKWTVQSLFNLTSKFVASLREHWPGFPASIAWIVQQMVHLLKQHSRTSERELHAVCTELVFNHFICPAVVSPEAHGVLDVPVSYIARFNLIQIAQVIQMLCLARYQEVEPKVRDLYNKFEGACVWSLVEAVCAEGSAPAPQPPPADAPLRTDSVRATTLALYTAHDLHLLITYLKRISSKLNNNTPSVTSEEASSSSGPVAEAAALSESSSEGSVSAGGACAAALAALLHTLEPNYRGRLHDLLRKVPDLTLRRQSPSSETKEPPVENGQCKKGILAKVPRARLPRSGSAGSSLATGGDERQHNGSVDGDAPPPPLEHPEVLIIKLANVEEHDYVGLVPESKVLECYYGGSEAGDGDADEAASALAAPPAPVQKRTRFSVSHDEVSLGNTSDNLEAASEAASNHSVTSSLELETEDQNDNLSDMVSANVSGRGSPNISGRETPSSQVTDGDAAGDAPPRRMPPHAPASHAANVQAKMLKQTRNDIEDKFCKFEIKKLPEGDETVSVMSDTWSTDVLASDSETIGDSCDHTQLAAAHGSAAGGAGVPDASETASESAWSMDVLASDSDRNTEVDTDDCVSVAARSDTSWPRRPSNHDESTPLRLQNGSLKRLDVSSPKHTVRPNLPNWSGGGYLSATAALSRGGELDLGGACAGAAGGAGLAGGAGAGVGEGAARAHHPQHSQHALDNRKSILVNGYPVMCYPTSAPESPSAGGGAPLPPPPFAPDFAPQPGGSGTESTVEGGSVGGGSHSDATSQWVDDSFPQPRPSPERAYPSAAAQYHRDHDADRSRGSSESSFNALSVSQYERRYDADAAGDVDNDAEADAERHHTDSRSTLTELMTRMSAATISSPGNIAGVGGGSGGVTRKAEIRTSIVSISSSRIEKRGEGTSGVGGVTGGGGGGVSVSSLSINSGGTSASACSSQDVPSELATERRVSPPPPAPHRAPSTGAIPKSISFDATAEKSQRRRLAEEALGVNLEELKSNVKRSGGNLLHRFRMFRQRGRAAHHQPSAATSGTGTAPVAAAADLKAGEEEWGAEQASPASGGGGGGGESSEDILAKYRRKGSGGGEARARRPRRPSDLPAHDLDRDRCEGVLDLSDPEVFNSMKRKLRAVLSDPELHCGEYVPSRCTSTSLVEWVRAAGAGAGGEAGAAHALELARALRAAAGAGGAGAGDGGLARLAAALRADLAARRPYAAYLASCRAALTHALHQLRRQIVHVRGECEQCARAAAATRALEQLERGNALRRLAKHHHAHNNYALLNGGELMDEKASRLTARIKAIIAEVKADPSWEGAGPTQLEAVEVTVERAVFSRLYLHVLFPNGDGDIARDQVLSEHIRRLAACTSAARAGVAPRHAWAVPFTRAQALLRRLPVYRTPRDKLACIMRCVTSIMAVLGLTEGAAPSADDLTPVLVFVILKVNPPSLLSTIELVSALGGGALRGEALYWWTQFCAAVAYIKTMDYPRADPADT